MGDVLKNAHRFFYYVSRNAHCIKGTGKEINNMKDYFKEIIGYEDVKKELRIISDMLNNPERYQKLGAKLNGGLILTGEPGTGKTTMANCLINSTKRKAYVIRKKGSDGEFIKAIEMTFEEAKNNSPSIILLDDLDKFSDKENGDAEEFVTVQSCIDEIKDIDVFVIATVNNKMKLPNSLLRAGRFGKRIKVRCPEKDEVTEIVDHYLKKTSICDEIDSKSVGMMLLGETCATLEDVINKAAIKAVYNRQEKVTMQNIIDTCLDLVFDAPERSKKLPESILRKVAYHEAGHAIISELLDPGSVTILSIRETKGGTRGFVSYYRPDEKEDFSAEYIEIMIKVSLAGRTATEIVFGETDIGAREDLRNAFDRALLLVDDQCMYGFQNWIEDAHDAFVSENRNRTIAMVMEKNYLEVRKMLAEHRELLDRMAAEALNKTTLVMTDIQRIMSEYGECNQFVTNVTRSRNQKFDY